MDIKLFLQNTAALSKDTKPTPPFFLRFLSTFGHRDAWKKDYIILKELLTT